MKSGFKYYLLVIIGLLTNVVIYAQSPILEGYIQQGLQSNLSLKQQDFELQKTVENIHGDGSYNGLKEHIFKGPFSYIDMCNIEASLWKECQFYSWSTH